MTTATTEAPTSALAESLLEICRRRFSYSPETGVIVNLTSNCKANAPVGQEAGYIMKAGYRLLSINEKRYYAHRIAWLMHYGAMPRMYIDHINGNKSDNRISNLRDVAPRVNAQNKRAPTGANTTGFLGVTFEKRRSAYVAQLHVGSKHVHVGQYESAEEAHSAYLNAKRIHNEGAVL